MSKKSEVTWVSENNPSQTPPDKAAVARVFVRASLVAAGLFVAAFSLSYGSTLLFSLACVALGAAAIPKSLYTSKPATADAAAEHQADDVSVLVQPARPSDEPGPVLQGQAITPGH